MQQRRISSNFALVVDMSTYMLSSSSSPRRVCVACTLLIILLSVMCNVAVHAQQAATIRYVSFFFLFLKKTNDYDVLHKTIEIPQQTISYTTYSSATAQILYGGYLQVSFVTTNNDSVVVGAYCMSAASAVQIDCNGLVPSVSITGSGSIDLAIPSSSSSSSSSWGIYINCNNWSENCQAGATAVVNPLPISFNPTSSHGGSASSCYTSVLDQGGCGSCWAFSSSTAYSIASCVQHNLTTFPQLSPQMLLNLAVSTGMTSSPCNGAIPAKALSMLSNFMQDNPGPSKMLSCSSYGGNGQCDSGCLPYQEIACLEGQTCNNISSWPTCNAPQLWSNHGASGCCCTPFSQLSCQPGTNTNFASTYSPVPPQVVFPVSCPHAHTTGEFHVNPSDGVATTQIKYWLQTNGPVVVSINVCNDFENSQGTGYFQQTLPAYVQQWTWQQQFLPPSFNGRCSGTTNHAVALVGWTTCIDGPCWIIQNSWASAKGDNGYFYVSIAAQNTGGVGDITLSDPIGLWFPDRVNQNAPIGCAVPVTFWQYLMSLLDTNTSVPGAPQPVVDLEKDEHISGILAEYRRSNQMDDAIQLTPYAATRQVVNGLVYSVHAHSSDQQTHHVSSLIHTGTGTTHILSSSSAQSQPNVSSIVGGVVGGVVALALIAVVIVVIVRRKRRLSPTQDTMLDTELLSS